MEELAAMTGDAGLLPNVTRFFHSFSIGIESLLGRG
jgi:hypothetical protein